MSQPTRTKIIVISMEDAAERRNRFEARAIGATVPWIFVRAHTALHPALTHSEEDAILAKGRPLRRGEIGCYSSHYAAWLDLQADDADQYIVLEDDVIVDWAFIAKIVDLEFHRMGIDYLRLYYKSPVRASLVRPQFIEQNRSIVELNGPAFGTQGYVITKAGARKLLDHCRVVRRPVDDEMDRSWVHGLRNLAIFPFPILEEATPSGIGEARYESYPLPENIRLRRAVTQRLDRWRRDAVGVVRRFQRLGTRLRSRLHTGNASR